MRFVYTYLMRVKPVVIGFIATWLISFNIISLNAETNSFHKFNFVATQSDLISTPFSKLTTPKIKISIYRALNKIRFINVGKKFLIDKNLESRAGCLAKSKDPIESAMTKFDSFNSANNSISNNRARTCRVNYYGIAISVNLEHSNAKGYVNYLIKEENFAKVINSGRRVGVHVKRYQETAYVSLVAAK